MKQFRFFLVFLICNFGVYSYAFEFFNELTPKSKCDIDIEYDYYQICYSKEHLQAFWAFHKLTKASIWGKQRRRNNFKRDHNIYPNLGPKDYKGSGYNRGHLVPAADMKLNYTAMSESFYMTNISPQKSGFNSGVWRAVEAGLRKEVIRRGDAFVVTAPVLLPFRNYPRIKSGVSVPDEYYKIAYFPKEELMLAFLIPNESQKGKKYTSFQVSVDELEKLTGYDFFSDLPDDLEDRLEGRYQTGRVLSLSGGVQESTTINTFHTISDRYKLEMPQEASPSVFKRRKYRRK